MKKNVLPLITLIIIILLTYFLLFLDISKEVTSQTEIDIIREDANLDILVNLGNFTKENYSEGKLLDISMQCSRKIGLIKEINERFFYIEYVNKEDIHKLINELTGILVDEPIEIEDFYYLYNEEEDYYYYVGSSPTNYNISEIKNVLRNENNYTIKCSIEKNEDGEITKKDDVVIKIKYVPENSIIKYQVEEIMINE